MLPITQTAKKISVVLLSLVMIASAIAVMHTSSSKYNNQTIPSSGRNVPDSSNNALNSSSKLTSSRDSSVNGNISAAPNLSSIPYAFPPNRNVMFDVIDGHVNPINYFNSPAPMGISDLGLYAVNGTVYSYSLMTSKLAGTISLANVSTYPFPDGTFSVQLNGVLYNVIIEGLSYSFWIQNVAVINLSNHTLQFVDNVWDLNNVVLNRTLIKSGNGSIHAGIVYIDWGPVFKLNLPFNLSLFLNSTATSFGQAVDLNYSLSSGSKIESGSYDTVSFGTVINGYGNSYPPDFLISGNQLVSSYMAYDAEFVLGGEYDGYNIDFNSINGTMMLDCFLNGHFVPVDSSFNHGFDTGETAAGVDVTYSDHSAVLQAGPSLLYGMWNVSLSSDLYHYSLNVTPSNAFVFVGQRFNKTATNYSWTPIDASGFAQFDLPTANYSLKVMLAGYTSIYIPSIGNVTDLKLVKNYTTGIDTPLYAFNIKQAESLSVSGNGSIENQFVLINTTTSGGPLSLNHLFSSKNSWGHSVFINRTIISNTRAYIQIMNSSYNSLYLVNTSHLSVEDSYILNMNISDSSGDLIVNSLFAIDFYNSDLMLWNSSNNYVAGNIFLYEIYQISNPGSALRINGAGNYIFSNSFMVIKPAYSLYFNGNGTVKHNFWNVSLSSLNKGITVNGFNLSELKLPFPITGGNLWLTDNATGPYNDGYMDSSDNSPSIGTLLIFSSRVFPTKFYESNYINLLVHEIPDILMMSAVTKFLHPFPDRLYLEFPTTGVYDIPKFNYTFDTSVQPIYAWDDSTFLSNAPSGEIQNNVSSAYINLTYETLNSFPVTFVSGGLGGDSTWYLEINNTDYGKVEVKGFEQTLLLGNGTYQFSVFPPDGTYASGGAFTVTGSNVTINVYFNHYSYISGHIYPQNATLYLNGLLVPTNNGSFNVTVKPGIYNVSVTENGYKNFSKIISIYPNITYIVNVSLQSTTNGEQSNLFVYFGYTLVALVLLSSIAIYRYIKRQRK